MVSASKIVWADAPSQLTRKTTFTVVYGDTDTGRTTWALTAPGPIALIHSAEKIEGIVQPFVVAGKVIKLVDFGGVFRSNAKSTDDRAKDIASQAMDKWRLLREAVFDSYTWARTTIVDTHTEAWQLARLAYFGAIKPSGGRIDANYGPVNGEWRSTLLNSQRQQDACNLILIGQTGDEWIKTPKNPMGARTGNTIATGQREVGVKADVIVRTSRDITDDGLVYSSTIEKGWWNSGVVNGMEFVEDMSTFPFVMSMVTNKDESEWG